MCGTGGIRQGIERGRDMDPLGHLKLRDDLPRYPHLIQLLRVTKATIPGPSSAGSSAVGTGNIAPGSLYISSTQQLRTDTLAPRDREPCLVVDVNNIGLSPGYYIGRLAGSYNSLPVYEVAEMGASAVPISASPTIGWTSTFAHNFVTAVSFRSATCLLTVTTETLTIQVSHGLVQTITIG